MRLIRLAIWALFTLEAAAALAHPPLPDTVLNPRTAAEAWNVLRLSAANTDQLLREDRLAEVPDQISLCSPALRALSRFAPAGRQRPVAEATVRAGAAVSSVAQSAMAGDRATAAGAFAALRVEMHGLSAYFDAAAVNADIYFCPMHPDFLSTDPTARCDRCGMGLQMRRIPYSFIYVPPGEPTIRLEAAAGEPLTAARETRAVVRLSQRDGSPVLLSDLQVVHTRPIHLLIIDPALEDYHHEHPLPTDKPGEYAFSFVSAKNAAYRVFADLVPFATGAQEFPFADLPGPPGPAPAAPRPHGDSTFSSESGGLRFALGYEPSDGLPPRARQVRNLRITVSEADGKPAASLEPVMNAFAHLVGFYDDGRTVLHLHPEGGEIVNPAQRGGPSLDFRFYAPKPGFIRLFCQVQAGGQAIYAPFNVNVLP